MQTIKNFFSILYNLMSKIISCEKAVKQLKEYYGIDGRIYGDSVFIAVWNEALSDTTNNLCI